MHAFENKKGLPPLLDKKSYSMVENKHDKIFDIVPSINVINERHPFERSISFYNNRCTDIDRYERTDNGVVNVERSPFRREVSISPSSITPISLFNLANNEGTFSQSLVTKNGFAIGNYYRYWQDLFDLRPCPSIYAITVTYEILGKEKARNFLLKHFEEKFIWLHDSFPLGFMYSKCHGPLSPPSTVEMMYALGEIAWTNGNGEYLIQYTRNAKVYIRDLNLFMSDELDDLPPLDIDVLIETISYIINYDIN